jgi:hypothetical protein
LFTVIVAYLADSGIKRGDGAQKMRITGCLVRASTSTRCAKPSFQYPVRLFIYASTEKEAPTQEAISVSEGIGAETGYFSEKAEGDPIR